MIELRAILERLLQGRDLAEAASLPAELEVTSRTTDQGEIMGVRHRELMVEGVQFHPESVLTPDGPRLLANFLRTRGGHRVATESGA
jgi:anthranilate/para-aminobenzoate synthase component II